MAVSSRIAKCGTNASPSPLTGEIESTRQSPDAPPTNVVMPDTVLSLERLAQFESYWQVHPPVTDVQVSFWWSARTAWRGLSLKFFLSPGVGAVCSRARPGGGKGGPP